MFRIGSFLVICAILNLSLKPGISGIAITCDVDDDCQLFGQYCYEGRECVNCTDCGLFNRRAKYNLACAKSIDDCGQCLEGYTEADETTDETKVRCVKQSNEESLMRFWNHFSVYSISTAVILIIIAIFVIILISKSELCKNPLFVKVSSMISTPSRNVNQVDPGDVFILKTQKDAQPTAPPVAQQRPEYHEGRKVCDNVQFANVFQYPSYMTGCQYTNDEIIYNLENENDTLLPTEMEFDENTQPSAWVPSPEASTSVVPNRAYSQQSFSGILDRPLSQNVTVPAPSVGSASRNVRVSMSTLSSQLMNDCSLNSNLDQSGGAEKNQ